MVLRTAGSKSKIDLVAIRDGIQLFIQCKRSGLLPTAEWNALVELAQMVRAVPVLAVGGRGERYWQLTAPKTKRGQRPMTPMDIQGE